MEVHIEYHHLLFPYIYNDIGNIDKYRHKEAEEIVKFYTSVYEVKSPMSKLEGIKFINELQSRIEVEMKNIISKKGIYYWFHLYRRIGVERSFKESKQTLWLYRNIMECAFLKYGKNTCGDELILVKKNSKQDIKKIASGLYFEAIEYFQIELSNKFNGIYLGNFNTKDLIEIYKLERLAYEFWYTTACKRRLYKDGSLFIKNNEYYVLNDSITENLIKFYDNRKSSFEDISATYGVLLNDVNKNNFKGTTLVPKYNIEKLSTSEYPYQVIFKLPLEYYNTSTEEPFFPNFLWLPFDFNYYYIAHDFLKSSFQKQFSYSLESFVTTLYLIIIQAIIFCQTSKNSSVGKDLMQRAYRHMTSKEKYIQNLIDLSKDIKLPALNDYILEYDEVSKIFKDLSVDSNEKINMSLTTLGPRKLFIPTFENGFIVDYASINFILQSHMHFIKENEDKKGHLFEDAIIQRLEKNNLQLWECKKILKHKDKTSKEIDISFCYKNVLYIGELKSNKMSMAFFEGDDNALEFRKKKLTKALNEVEEKAKWLLNHKEGKNYKIPETVNVIIPIIVSPFAEYIWTLEEELWINKTTPRICIASDLYKLATDEIINEVVKKPFAYYLI